MCHLRDLLSLRLGQHCVGGDDADGGVLHQGSIILEVREVVLRFAAEAEVGGVAQAAELAVKFQPAGVKLVHLRVVGPTGRVHSHDRCHGDAVLQHDAGGTQATFDATAGVGAGAGTDVALGDRTGSGVGARLVAAVSLRPSGPVPAAPQNA